MPKRRIRIDTRPICDCSAYKFPHKIGGKCKGIAFATFHFYQVRSSCEFCNCFCDDRTPISCDVVDGKEPIASGDCYREQCHHNSGEHLPLTFKEQEDEP